MRSIIYQLGYDDFLRVRVGIGIPEGELNMVSHVLGKPKDDELEVLLDSLKAAANAVEMILSGELSKAQELYNKKPKKPKPTDSKDQSE